MEKNCSRKAKFSSNFGHLVSPSLRFASYLYLGRIALVWLLEFPSCYQVVTVLRQEINLRLCKIDHTFLQTQACASVVNQAALLLPRLLNFYVGMALLCINVLDSGLYALTSFTQLCALHLKEKIIIHVYPFDFIAVLQFYFSYFTNMLLKIFFSIKLVSMLQWTWQLLVMSLLVGNIQTIWSWWWAFLIVLFVNMHM